MNPQKEEKSDFRLRHEESIFVQSLNRLADSTRLFYVESGRVNVNQKNMKGKLSEVWRNRCFKQERIFVSLFRGQQSYTGNSAR